jgi:hypothetical protein
MTLLRFATLFLASNCSLAFGQEGIPQLPAAARSEVVRHCPSFSDVAEVAIGDINGDGLDDVAAIIQCVENGSERNKIVVLTSTSDKRFVFEVESASWEPHMRRNEYIGIEKKTIQITASTSSYTDYSGTLYKFLYRSGAFTLVGLEYSEGQIGDDGGSGISANFLTNKLIAWSKNSKGARHESKGKLKSDYKIQLREFNLEEAVDAQSLR